MAKAKAIFTVELPVTQRMINNTVDYMCDYLDMDFTDNVKKQAKFNLGKFKAQVKKDPVFIEAYKKALVKFAVEQADDYNGTIVEYVEDNYKLISDMYEQFESLADDEWEEQNRDVKISNAIEILENYGYTVTKE